MSRLSPQVHRTCTGWDMAGTKYTTRRKCRCNQNNMARPPVDISEIIAKFGPTLNHTPAMGWNADVQPDRIVKTHCCFCGQQCGIQLKVKDNKVIGFEPWEDFPFNQGRLCPKGVKRYLQDEHPDRLKSPLLRKDGTGFVPVP